MHGGTVLPANVAVRRHPHDAASIDQRQDVSRGQQLGVKPRLIGVRREPLEDALALHVDEVGAGENQAVEEVEAVPRSVAFVLNHAAFRTVGLDDSGEVGEAGELLEPAEVFGPISGGIDRVLGHRSGSDDFESDYRARKRAAHKN